MDVKYCRVIKIEEVDAIQFDGTIESGKNVLAWLKRNNYHGYLRMDGGGTVSVVRENADEERLDTLNRNDFFVLTARGVSAHTHKQFNEQFQELPTFVTDSNIS